MIEDCKGNHVFKITPEQARDLNQKAIEAEKLRIEHHFEQKIFHMHQEIQAAAFNGEDHCQSYHVESAWKLRTLKEMAKRFREDGFEVDVKKDQEVETSSSSRLGRHMRSNPFDRDESHTPIMEWQYKFTISW